MLSNATITYYHKTLGQDRLEKWDKYTFEKVWKFGGKGSSINKGYDNANNVDVRIPIEKVNDVTIFQLGDILAIGELNAIETQEDLQGQEFYNVTSININNFGGTPHVHLGGK